LSLSTAARRGGEADRETLRALGRGRRGSSSLLLSAPRLAGERDGEREIDRFTSVAFLGGEREADLAERCCCARPAPPFEKREALGGDFEGDLEAAVGLAGDLDTERVASCILARGGDLEREGEGERDRRSLAWGRGDLERPRVAFTLSFSVAALPLFLDLRAGAEEMVEEELLLLLLEEEEELLEDEELEDPLLLSLSLLLLDELLELELELPLLEEELEESLSELLLSLELLLLSPPLSSRIFCCSRS